MSTSPPRGLLGRIHQRLRQLDRTLADSALKRFEAAHGTEATPRAAVRSADLDALVRVLTPERRPLIEHHWATWCDGCVEELPLLAELFEAVGARVDVVLVSWDRFQDDRPMADTLATVTEVLEARGLAVPTRVYDGTPDALFAGLDLPIHQVPQTRVLDADGGILRTVPGPLDRKSLDALIDLLST